MVTLDKHIGVERTTETKELFPKRLKGSPHPGVTNRLAPPIASATVKPLANTCQFQEVLCPKKCKKMITRRNLSEHLKRDCLCRDYSCEHCREKGTYHTITGECGEFGPCRHHGNSHYDRCQHYPVKCPNKCSKTIKRGNVGTHRESCPLEPVECSFSEVGCRGKLMRRDVDNHMATSDHQHLLLMMKAFKELKQETTRKKETEQLREEVSEIKARVVSLEEKSQPILKFGGNASVGNVFGGGNRSTSVGNIFAPNIFGRNELFGTVPLTAPAWPVAVLSCCFD